MKASIFFLFQLLALASCYPVFQITSNLATTTAAATSSKAQTKVKNAANAFASDVGTVSNSINKLATATDTKTIKSLASTGFSAEKDEDTHRAVLNTAAGFTGSSANAKIVKNTPIVLDGLQSIMQSPTTATVKKTLPKVQSSR